LDEAVEKLAILFSEQLLLAALDLIDRDCGMRKHRPLLFSPLIHENNEPYNSYVISNSDKVHFSLGSKPFFRSRDDRFLHRFSEPA
jgi:hypothetical protein